MRAEEAVGVDYRVGSLRVTGLARDGNAEQRRWRVLCDCTAVETRGERALTAARRNNAKSACKRCQVASNRPPRHRGHRTEVTR